LEGGTRCTPFAVGRTLRHHEPLFSFAFDATACSNFVNDSQTRFSAALRQILVTFASNSWVHTQEALVPDSITDSAETARLLMRIDAGDRAAFDQLFERHRDTLRRAVQLRLDPQLKARLDASDIVQEAHMEAFRRLDDYLRRRPMPFSLWLRKTAQEQVYNHRRAHLHTARRSVRREHAIPDQSSMMIAAPFIVRGSSPSQRMATREQRRLVSEAVGELADLDREILLMRNVEGLAHMEIAQVLGLTHDAVRKRYGRALLKLQQLLAAKGLTEFEL
jgi:RNA polymerase sigma-70 factor (ECF subfamily)